MAKPQATRPRAGKSPLIPLYKRGNIRTPSFVKGGWGRISKKYSDD
jgi:hypothetical protein